VGKSTLGRTDAGHCGPESQREGSATNQIFKTAQKFAPCFSANSKSKNVRAKNSLKPAFSGAALVLSRLTPGAIECALAQNRNRAARFAKAGVRANFRSSTCC